MSFFVRLYFFLLLLFSPMEYDFLENREQASNKNRYWIRNWNLINSARIIVANETSSKLEISRKTLLYFLCWSLFVRRKSVIYWGGFLFFFFFSFLFSEKVERIFSFRHQNWLNNLNCLRRQMKTPPTASTDI